MMRQWPLLIPFVSLAAGLTLSYLGGITCSNATVGALLVCLLLASFHRSALIFSIILSLFFLVFGMNAITPWLTPDNSTGSIRSHASATVTILQGVIAERPTMNLQGGTVVVKVESLIRGRNVEQVHGRLLLYVSEGDVNLLRGDRIRFMSRISIPRRLGLPGEFDYPRYLALQKISAIGRVASQGDIVLVRSAAEDSVQRRIDEVAWHLGDAIRRAQPDENVSSVLAALLIGDQRRIPRELANAYTRSGVNHILSISGFHIGIIAAFISMLSLWIFTRYERIALYLNVRRLAIVIAIPAMLFYLFLTGNAPATARSVIMLATFALALYAERESDSINTLLMAAFVLTALNPPTLFDVSFQLSFLALWGIVLATRTMAGRLNRIASFWYRMLASFIVASVAATCATIIPVLFVFKVATLNGIITNFLVVPLLGYGAVLSGVCVLPVLPFFPDIAHLLLWPAGQLVIWSNQIIQHCAELPVIKYYGITTTDMCMLLLFLGSMSFITHAATRKVLVFSLPFFAFMLHMTSPAAVDGRLHITMLSVGQAESILLRMPDGAYVLVDGGGYLHENGLDFGQRILGPALGAIGVTAIEKIISTHDHPDHNGGFPFVVSQFRVGEYLCSPAGDASKGTGQLPAILKNRRVPMRVVAAGDRLDFSGGVAIEVLAPETRRQHSDDIDLNEESLVFRLSMGDFSMLFTADAGFEAERHILAKSGVLGSTVLKVGHHGSRYSTSDEFLTRINPRAAFISAGAANRFGLPAQETLEQLKTRGIKVYRTDCDGTIELVTDGKEWSVATPYRQNEL